MKKRLIGMLLAVVMMTALVGCTKNAEVSPFDLIKDSVTAKMELPDRAVLLVDGEMDLLKTLGDMSFSILEDSDAREQDWSYCVTYHSEGKAKEDTETKVLFYGDYIKIGGTCYVPSDDAQYKEIVSWVKSEFNRSRSAE